MADKTVGLTVRFIDEFTAPLQKIHGAIDELSRKFTGLGIDSLISFGALVKGFEKIFEETTKAEVGMVRFTKAVAAMGGNAGVNVSGLEEFTKKVVENTGHSDDSVRALQVTLLNFGEITGTIFTQAEKAATDLAENAVFNGSLEGAASTLGRALQNPSNAMRTLRNAGVALTTGQQELIKGFVESGNKMKAQQIIIDAVEKSYGGLSEEIGNTTAGAVRKLGDSFNELFELTADGLDPLKEQLLGLNEQLINPENKAAIQSFFGLIINLAGLAAKAVLFVVTGLGLVVQAAKGDFLDELNAKLSVGKSALDKLQGNDKGFGGGQRKGTAEQIEAQKKINEGIERQIYLVTKLGYTSQDLTLNEFDPSKLVQRKAVPRTQTDGDADAKAKLAEEAAKSLAAVLASANEATMTSYEKTAATVDKFIGDLNTLFKAGAISIEEYQARLDEFKNTANTDFMKGYIDDMEKVIGDTNLATTATDELKAALAGVSENLNAAFGEVTYSRQQIQAIEGIQSAFSAMFGAVDQGLKGMLRAFVSVLKNMAIQALAANLAEKMFGKIGQGGQTSGGSGWFGKILGIVFSAYTGGASGGVTGGYSGGGAAASGGEDPAGMTLVGETGPELISHGPARVFNAQQLSYILGNKPSKADSGSGGDGNDYGAQSVQSRVAGMLDRIFSGRSHGRPSGDMSDLSGRKSWSSSVTDSRSPMARLMKQLGSHGKIAVENREHPPTYGAMASGGEMPGGMTLVGETGPELISTGPGRVFNSQQLAFAGGNAGSSNANYAPVTTINVQGSMDKVTEARIYAYIEAARTKDKRELGRLIKPPVDRKTR